MIQIKYVAHVNYRKKQLKKELLKGKVDRGEKKRKRILDKLAYDSDDQTDSSTGDDGLNSEDLPGESEIESDSEDGSPTKKIKLSEPSKHLYNHQMSLIKEQVSSDSISSKDDMKKLAEDIKTRTKAEIRSSRITEKEREKNDIVKSMKISQTNQEQRSETNQLLQIAIMNMLNKEDVSSKTKKLAKENEKNILKLSEEMKNQSNILEKILEKLNNQ